jgi:hypothetical protein
VHVPTVFKRPTDTDDCFERIDIIAIEPIEHTPGVSDAHEIAPEPADGAAVSPGPACVTKYVEAAPVIVSVRVAGDTVVVVVVAAGAEGGGLTTVTAVASVATAGPSRPLAIAMSANVANQYGWYQISGLAVARKAAAVSFADGAGLGSGSGLAVAVATGSVIQGAVVRAVASAKSDVVTVAVAINRPHGASDVS